MKVDAFGAFLGCRFAIPEMVKGGGGSIINMVSMAGYGNNTGGRAGYGMSKAAAMNLTRTIAHSYMKDGVRANGIAPAVVGTERIRKQLAALPEAKAAMAGQPMGVIDPEDIGYAAIFLASDESKMITGHVIPIHAGSFGD